MVIELDPCAPSQSASLHLAAAVGEDPQDTVPGRLWGAGHFQNCHNGVEISLFISEDMASENLLYFSLEFNCFASLV